MLRGERKSHLELEKVSPFLTRKSYLLLEVAPHKELNSGSLPRFAIFLSPIGTVFALRLAI
jgi:hypothetical protein